MSFMGLVCTPPRVLDYTPLCSPPGSRGLSHDCRGVGPCRALSGHCRATVGLIDLTLMSSVGACCRGLSGAP